MLHSLASITLCATIIEKLTADLTTIFWHLYWEYKGYKNMYEGVGLGKQSKSSTSTVESYRQCLKFSKLRSNSTRMILNKLEQNTKRIQLKELKVIILTEWYMANGEVGHCCFFLLLLLQGLDNCLIMSYK